MKKLLLAAATLAVGSYAQVALAATAIDNDMDISVTVAASCTISVTDMTFAAITTRDTGASHTATSTATIACTADADYDVGFDTGLNEDVDGTGPARLINSNASAQNLYLTYGLYQDAAHEDIWGSTLDTNTVPGTGNGDDQTLTVYGLIDASQEVSLGTYTDTVTATVWYN